MSEKISGMISKFSKWLVIRKELKFDKALEKVTVPEIIRDMEKNHSDVLLAIHIRHQVVQLILLFAGIVSAILTVFGILK